ncbi:MAG: hypothetical protein MH204_07055, partial [Fimbriimonadaceae bacterium]|nr:hypothetical protein [Fimbriimonadaceae bacterium]
PREACESVIRHMNRRHAEGFRLPCVVLAMNPQGQWGAAAAGGDFDLWIRTPDGAVSVEHFEPLFP